MQRRRPVLGIIKEADIRAFTNTYARFGQVVPAIIRFPLADRLRGRDLRGRGRAAGQVIMVADHAITALVDLICQFWCCQRSESIGTPSVACFLATQNTMNLDIAKISLLKA
jgi:hypothetical protein